MNLQLFVIFFIQLSYCLSDSTDINYVPIPDLFHLEDYDKCLFTPGDKNPNYCSLTIQLQPENARNLSRVWRVIEELSSDNRNYRHDLPRHGICTSKICSNFKGTISDCLDNHYKSKYKNLGLVGQIKEIRCESPNSHYKIETPDIIISILLGVYVTFVISVSIWLEFGKRKSKHDTTNNKNLAPTQKYFSAFSIFDNLRSITSVEHQGEDYMPFLQTARFVLSLLVIFGHVKNFDKITPLLNPDRYEKKAKTWFHLIFSQGKFMVSIFFLISSWLMAVKFFKKLKQEGKVGFGHVAWSIIKRYMRFTSGHVVIVALHSTLLVHLFRGPFWESMMGAERKMCREHWWLNLLYVGNFVFSDGICLFHTWSLSVDFQLTVLGLFILWLTQKKPRNLILASGAIISAHVLITFFYLFSNNYKFSILFTPELTYHLRVLFVKEWQATWTSTCSNLAALGCGLWLGYLHTEYENKKFITEMKYAKFWWILTAALIVGTPLASMCFMTTWYYENSRWFTAAYGSVDKVFFIFGIALLIFGLSQDVGGVFKKFIEWTPMHTLGQLSFGAYLIHYTFLEIEAGLRRTLHYMSDYLMFAEFIKHLTYAYMASIILTTFFLLPMDRLSKMLNAGKTKTK